MIYLSQFTFPDYDAEYDFRLGIKRTCYNNMYPFFILSKNQLEVLDFELVTILYGGNGSGKTTALNIIAEKLKLQRDTLFNRSSFFEDYTKMCFFKLSHRFEEGRIITSDDVFEYILNVRAANENIDKKREQLLNEYLEAKYSEFKMTSLEDYDALRKVVAARSRTQSKYVNERLSGNLREHSNGENAFRYFTEKIREKGVYLLDEPENSLSPERQLELLKFIEESARFYDCQFIIATHSPFLLSIRGAKIYDFDENPVDVKRWTELKNVRAYYNFFKQNESEFNK